MSAALYVIAHATPAWSTETLGRATNKTIAAQWNLCRQIMLEQVEHVVCEINPRLYRIDLHWKDVAGSPLGTLGAVERELEAAGRQPLVTMNAGMYEADLSPVGLFIAGGKTLHPANMRDGKGNFYLKPNGVFYMKGHKAGVMETRTFLKSRYKPDIATQSGPMLVIKGRIHPRFEREGMSRKIRNGVGVRRDGTIVLAISRQGISFGGFARLFRDTLKCPDALYLDGSISRISVNGEAKNAGTVQSLLVSEKRIGTALSVSKLR
ncbi:phosphodiester glycosidase family protein [Pseudochelatococcus sp. G4_1912]|uniref:phosphodiester glycosidase family protein n=1 Tax=Pseudochelatococcus sp. G4_1912 TaxID=3114288 RepID=UPI0039C5D3D3